MLLDRFDVFRSLAARPNPNHNPNPTGTRTHLNRTGHRDAMHPHRRQGAPADTNPHRRRSGGTTINCGPGRPFHAEHRGGPVGWNWTHRYGYPHHRQYPPYLYYPPVTSVEEAKSVVLHLDVNGRALLLDELRRSEQSNTGKGWFCISHFTIHKTCRQ